MLNHVAYFLLGFFGALLVGIAHQETEPADISPTIH